MWGGDWAATACSPDAACELDGMEASCEEVLRRCSGREDTLSHSQEDLRVMGSLVLRHALGWCGNGPCLHHSLRSRVLEGNASGPRKYLFDMVMFSLLEQHLLERHGQGNWAVYTIPEASLARAECIAYSDFQGDAVLLKSATAGSAPAHPGAAIPSCGRRLAGRGAHAFGIRSLSPLGASARVKAGIEKRHRSKRGLACDVPGVGTLQKKLRYEHDPSGGGLSPMHM
ncbi:hypothetical protein ACKKBG_A08085 [Auxenochlorella protothecoides x Auxenochlorella symbiontica]